MKFWKHLRLAGSAIVIALAAVASVAALLQQADSSPTPSPQPSFNRTGPTGL
jgi:hypothetical protein